MSFNEDLYHFSQGFFYLSIPLLLVTIGFQLHKIFSKKQFFTFLVVAGNVISLFFIISTLFKVGFSAFLSPYAQARLNLLGSGAPAPVLSLIICLFSDKFGLVLFNNNFKRYLSILLSLIAIYLFASRTYWVMVFIFVCIFIFKTMKSDRLLFLIILFLGSLFLIINYVNSQNELSYSTSILYKLTHSLTEIKISNFKTFRDINLNYRGYEAYRSWISYREGGFLELMFGSGLGKLIDLNTKIQLAGKVWSEVPVIHNGFFLALVKTGALGFIAILLFFFYITKEGLSRYKSKNTDQQFMSIFLVGCSAALFMANFVVGGLYNFEMSILLITSGYLISKLSPETYLRE
jgi:hypothetical protein